MRRIKGFTLIELLIVVAIIAILAAIAVPNFLEAQVRSKVSRVKSDMRSLATALESYCVDSNAYPPGQHGQGANWGRWNIGYEFRLTTPIAYMTSTNFPDPFAPTKDFVTPSGVTEPVQLQYINYGPESLWLNFMGPFNPEIALLPRYKGWCLSSWGPDRTQSGVAPRTDVWAFEWLVYTDLTDPPGYQWTACDVVYDPTNGTTSYGDIGRLGGAVPAKFMSLVNK
jgi:prepilin-type N-terminal cleavage/methylation domain-containing protein